MSVSVSAFVTVSVCRLLHFAHKKETSFQALSQPKRQIWLNSVLAKSSEIFSFAGLAAASDLCCLSAHLLICPL